jgi:hypothetical protein
MRLISLIIIGVICFYLGAYKNRISGFVEEYFPEVKEAVKKRVAKIQEGSQPQMMTITPSPEKRIDPQRDDPAGQKQHSPRDIRIASFYISSFSDNNRGQELIYTAQIIKYFDLIAIQGIETEAALKKIVDILKGLGLTYAYTFAASQKNGPNSLHAFLYRSDEISVIQGGTIYRAKSSPFIWDPFYATFQARHFDFTLVNIHVSWGSDEEQRRVEIAALPELYNFIQKGSPLEQDIILLGHFNLPPEDPVWDNLKRFPTMTCLINPPDTTNIAGTRNYDNIWFQQKYCREYTGRSGVTKFDENMFKNNDQKAGSSVSDYRPVWADFRVSQPDDD